MKQNTHHSANSLAPRAWIPAAQLAAAPVVNLYMTGCNIQQGAGNQYIAGGDSRALAETIRAQAEIIAAQQRTIDRLITMLERLTTAQQ